MARKAPPGFWKQLWIDVWRSFGKPERTIVGEDRVGNVYYYEQSRTGGGKRVTRGYVPPDVEAWPRVPVQWESWLRGRRKLPPSDAELAADDERLRSIAERVAAEGISGADRLKKGGMPEIDTEGGHEKGAYPMYEGFEKAPGGYDRKHLDKDEPPKR